MNLHDVIFSPNKVVHDLHVLLDSRFQLKEQAVAVRRFSPALVGTPVPMLLAPEYPVNNNSCLIASSY